MVRLDIVSGFLGAGKTTFIKKVINSCITRHEKIVLIENEFGQINIDSELLKLQEFPIYELLQGCVCCTLKEDFFHTIKEILPQKPDRIIFEPSGIFIFNEIMDLFKDPKISSNCCLNSVTTIVDGQNFIKNNHSFAGFFDNQIANASTLLLNKIQNLSDAEINQITQQLRQKNKEASIITKDWDEFLGHEIMLILDGNIKYALHNLFEDLPENNIQHIHHAKQGFESVGVRTSRIFDLKELDHILKQFSNSHFGNVLRGKGIIRTKDTCLEFNYVNGQYQISPSTSSIATSIASFIGIGLEKEKLLSMFN
ncbi:MAG: GTP-binding protein [Dehalobacterium sp.]